MLEKYIPAEWNAIIHADTGRLLLRILVILAAGSVVLRLILWLIGSFGKRGLTEKFLGPLKRMIFYSGLVVLALLVLNQLGIDLTAVLGAAGIAGIALGFAAQTSISNIISGIFLLSENAFIPGDVIQVGSVTGTILSIDLLSIKVRTFDNRYVRIPNETLIKAELTNVTRLPIRRMEMSFVVGYETDLARLKSLLLGLVKRLPNCLEEPEPLFLIQDYGPRGVEILFGVWCTREDFLTVNNLVKTEILSVLGKEGIKLPTTDYTPEA